MNPAILHVSTSDGGIYYIPLSSVLMIRKSHVQDARTRIDLVNDDSVYVLESSDQILAQIPDLRETVEGVRRYWEAIGPALGGR